MTRIALFLAAIAIAVLARHEAHACSCGGPTLSFLSPIGATTAPTNTHVRVVGPTGNFQTSRLVLRAHNGPAVVTTARSYPGTMVTIVELVPAVALQPDTRFEVATIDPNAHPPTTVIGTFKTGASTDTTAPQLDSLGRQRTRLNTMYGGGDCSIRGPWIELAGVVAHDDRADTKLAFGVWSANAAGVIDTTKQPDTLLFAYDDQITIGASGSCDPRTFPLTGSTASLAIAAIDDAGNTSRALRFRADLTHATP